VLVFLETVTEGQRVAAMQMREIGVNGKKHKSMEPEDEENSVEVKKRKATHGKDKRLKKKKV